MMYRPGDIFVVTQYRPGTLPAEYGYLTVLKEFQFDKLWEWFRTTTGPGLFAGENPYCSVFLDYLVEEGFLGKVESRIISMFPLPWDNKIYYSTLKNITKTDEQT